MKQDRFPKHGRTVSCIAGSTWSRALIGAVVLMALGGAGQSAVNEIYTGSGDMDGEIRKTTQFAPETITPIPTVLGFLTAEDPSTGKIYYCTGSKIKRADYSCSNSEDLVTGLSTTTALALDLANGKMYWVDGEAGSIQRANLNGALTETLVSGLPTSGGPSPFGYPITGLALDAPNGKMYWVDGSTNAIQRANLSGAFVESVTPATAVAGPMSIAVDSADGRMYWSNADNTIARAYTNGSNPETILTGIGMVLSITLDTAKGKIYWGDLSSTYLWRANLNGTTKEDVILLPAAIPVSSVSLDATHQILFWADIVSGNISRTNLPIFDTLATNVPAPLDVELLYSSTSSVEKVYWSAWDMMTPDTGVIGCANPDGSNRQILLTNLPSPTGVAVDSVGRKLYWCDFSGVIYSANLDGSNQTVVITGVGPAADLEVDPAMGRLYWADIVGMIRRVDFTGLNLSTIVSGAGQNYGLAVDSVGGRVYWSDRSSDTIQRANLDGSNLVTLVTCPHNPVGVELDTAGGMLYWTGGGAVHRKNLSNSAEEQLIGGMFNCGFIALNTGITNSSVEGEGEGVLSVTITGASLVSKDSGGTHVFEINVSGAIGAITYQWEKQNQAAVFQTLPDGNNPWYILTSLTPENSGVYRCSVADTVTSDISNTVQLTVGTQMPTTGLLGLTGLAMLLALGGGLCLHLRRTRTAS